MLDSYDIIVVGGGHAGCEAAHVAAKMGSKVLLLTMNMNTIAQMSCNPAMGGVAKGQIVREIDALGGGSGIISDKSAIQFRMLNLSKGPAMWSPRTQNDRMLFAQEWRNKLEQTQNLDFWQDSCVGLMIEKERIVGVKTALGINIYASAVILTNGTFLNGVIHLGEKQFGGGRIGEKASKGITEELIELGFSAGRMKTGTPPRIDGRSLNYSMMEEQKGDTNPSKFCFSNETQALKEQRSCHITYTNSHTHELLKEGFDRSPMFNGAIQSTGPRYCPSIEDKINRFAERDRHQIFVEPEGWNTVEIYVNGFSTSLPEEVQIKALRSIKGFEQAKMFRPGYAIEYDYFPPTQLTHTLETKLIQNLYFSGQINGTTGYEEAACQGLMAGINAHLKLNNKDPFVLSRNQAYIGVLIDDLITKGTDEPYRMFTSRAEFRIMLRQDNADSRLSPLAMDLGTISKERINELERKEAGVKNIKSILSQTGVKPSVLNKMLHTKGSSEVKQQVKLSTIITRPNVSIMDLESMDESLKTKLSYWNSIDPEIAIQAEIQMKYSGYIEREEEQAEKINRLEKQKIPLGFDFKAIKNLSSEAREKLMEIQPTTVGQASRVSGVSPSDISVLLISLGR